jgi:hypothetical protein
VELLTTPDGNPVGNTYDAVIAIDADVAQLLVPINVPVNEPLNDPVLIWIELDTNPVGLFVIVFQSLLAFAAYDAVNASDADVAQLLVPNNEPVMPEVTFNAPDIIELPTTNSSVAALLESVRDPVITVFPIVVWLPVTTKDPVISNPLDKSRYPEI